MWNHYLETMWQHIEKISIIKKSGSTRLAVKWMAVMAGIDLSTVAISIYNKSHLPNQRLLPFLVSLQGNTPAVAAVPPAQVEEHHYR